MKVPITDEQGGVTLFEVDDLSQIEAAYTALYDVPTPATQALINAQYGTPQVRAQNKSDFQGWMDDVNTAIANTENDLPVPANVNLATLQAMAVEINAIRRRQNRIMKAIRHIARLLLKIT